MNTAPRRGFACCRRVATDAGAALSPGLQISRNSSICPSGCDLPVKTLGVKAGRLAFRRRREKLIDRSARQVGVASATMRPASGAPTISPTLSKFVASTGVPQAMLSNSTLGQPSRERGVDEQIGGAVNLRAGSPAARGRAAEPDRRGRAGGPALRCAAVPGRRRRSRDRSPAYERVLRQSARAASAGSDCRPRAMSDV